MQYTEDLANPPCASIDQYNGTNSITLVGKQSAAADSQWKRKQHRGTGASVALEKFGSPKPWPWLMSLEPLVHRAQFFGPPFARNPCPPKRPRDNALITPSCILLQLGPSDFYNFTLICHWALVVPFCCSSCPRLLFHVRFDFSISTFYRFCSVFCFIPSTENGPQRCRCSKTSEYINIIHDPLNVCYFGRYTTSRRTTESSVVMDILYMPFDYISLCSRFYYTLPDQTHDGLHRTGGQ